MTPRRLCKSILTISGPRLEEVSELPSDYRYSSSLAMGLGIVHIGLGGLSLFFSVLAVFFEPSVNSWASGIWTSPFHILCGICGIMARRRWYIDYQAGTHWAK